MAARPPRPPLNDAPTTGAQPLDNVSEPASRNSSKHVVSGYSPSAPSQPPARRSSRSRSTSVCRTPSAAGPKADVSDGPLAAATADELRDRLVGMQRRLAKEGVRTARLESALKEERNRNSELLLELKESRVVQRGRLPIGRLRAEGIGDDCESQGDVAKPGVLIIAELRAQNEAFATRLRAAQDELQSAELGRLNSSEESEKASISAKLQLDAFQEKEELRLEEKFANRLKATEDELHSVELCRRHALEGEDAAISVNLRLETFEENELLRLEETFANRLRAAEENSHRAELCRQREAEECEQAAMDIKLRLETSAKEERDRVENIFSDEVRSLVVELEASEEQLANGQEQREEQFKGAEERYNEQFLCELHAQVDGFQHRSGELEIECEERVAAAGAEAALTCEKSLAEARVQFDLKLTRHGERVTADVTASCEEAAAAELAAQVASLRQQVEDSADLGKQKYDAWQEECTAEYEGSRAELVKQGHAAESELEIVRQRLNHERGAWNSERDAWNAEHQENIELQSDITRLHQRTTALAQDEEVLRRRLLAKQEDYDEEIRIYERRVETALAEAAETAQAASTNVEERLRKAEEAFQQCLSETFDIKLAECKLAEGQMDERHEEQLASELRRCREEVAQELSPPTACVEVQVDCLMPEKLTADNSKIRLQLAQQKKMFEQQTAALDAAQQTVRQLQEQLSQARQRKSSPVESGNDDFGQVEELQQLLELAHEENQSLREQVERQSEEIALLESSVLGALDDIRDDGATGRRWAGSGVSSKPPVQQRASSQPSRATVSRSPAPSGRSTPPRKPGDIRKVPVQPRGGDRSCGNFQQLVGNVSKS